MIEAGDSTADSASRAVTSSSSATTPKEYLRLHRVGNQKDTIGIIFHASSYEGFFLCVEETLSTTVGARQIATKTGGGGSGRDLSCSSK